MMNTVGLTDQANSVDGEELSNKFRITMSRPKIPDCAANDDEGLEPQAWHRT